MDSSAVPGQFGRGFSRGACIFFNKMAATEETSCVRSPKKIKNRGINWSDKATEILLELWSEESIQLSLEHSKSSKETRVVYGNLKVSYMYFFGNDKHLNSHRENTSKEFPLS